MLKNIILQNFRSYDKYNLNLEPITIITGPNGRGKTNLIEAIWMLSTIRSWRADKDWEVIRWGENFARIESGDLSLYLSLADKEKIFLEKKLRKKLIEAVGRQKAVLFVPESIEAITGSPALRRKLLDILFTQIDQNYGRSLLELQKILKNRNAILNQFQDVHTARDNLEFWNQELILVGSKIIKKRKELIEFLDKILAEKYKSISLTGENLNIIYRPVVRDLDKYNELLQNNLDSELRVRATLLTPTRDDFEILLNKKNIANFGSRGEQRSAILALKSAELDFVKNKTGESPILLLDDVFSELDKNRREHLAEIVSNQQTVITTTDVDYLAKDLQKDAKIINL